jgi:hypothetical protein
VHTKEDVFIGAGNLYYGAFFPSSFNTVKKFLTVMAADHFSGV